MKTISVSKKIENIINICIENAEDSPLFMRHGAAIVKGGTILGQGHNHERGTLKGNQLCSFHAEVAALYRVLSGTALYYSQPPCRDERRGEEPKISHHAKVQAAPALVF